MATSGRLGEDSKYLKVHMLNGDLYVLSTWEVSADATRITGVGDYYGPNRELRGSFPVKISVADVALFETNTRELTGRFGGLVVVTGVSAAATVACAASPKSCFGSCPTFYWSDGEEMRIQAEAFSASIAPALEANDVDALVGVRPRERRLELRVTNEALETHVIRSADLLAARAPGRGDVFATADGDFYGAEDVVAPLRCEAAEGNCLEPVRALDRRERASEADDRDLAVREHISLEFEPPPGEELGLVIEARQTFLTTFLLYQGLAFLGREAVARIAAIERGDEKLLQRARGLAELLGGVEVQVRSEEGLWHTVGAFEETGPIATDLQLIRLPRGVDASRVRLRLTRGHWRLGYVALVKLSGPVSPIRLEPIAVEAAGEPAPGVLESLRDKERTLVTLPGDAYTLVYHLPDEPEAFGLFLDARGYYLEWMREEWLEEENPLGAAMMLYTPRIALRVLAPAFKRLEPHMEEAFWNSRYAD